MFVRLYLLWKLLRNDDIDLSKQQALDANPKTIQQINFAASLDEDGNTRFYFILDKAKETVFEFSQRTVKVL